MTPLAASSSAAIGDSGMIGPLFETNGRPVTLEYADVRQRPAGRKRRALACSMGYPSAPSKLVCRHHTAVPGPKRAAGVQCRHCHRPAGNFVAATDGVNESRTPSGTAPGARAEPVKPCPAFTLSGGPAPSRVGEFARNLRMHSQTFPAPPRQFCL